MLIRAEQLQVLTAAAMTNFKVTLLQHVRDYFPREYAVLGDACTRTLVDCGVINAQRYGFKGKRDICNFIDLMLSFGPDFDRDPALGWVQAILNNHSLQPTVKMQALLRNADEALRTAPWKGSDRGE